MGKSVPYLFVMGTSILYTIVWSVDMSNGYGYPLATCFPAGLSAGRPADGARQLHAGQVEERGGKTGYD